MSDIRYPLTQKQDDGPYAGMYVPLSEVIPLIDAVRKVMGSDGREGHETFHGQEGKVQVNMGPLLRRAEEATMNMVIKR